MPLVGRCERLQTCGYLCRVVAPEFTKKIRRAGCGCGGGGEDCEESEVRVPAARRVPGGAAAGNERQREKRRLDYEVRDGSHICRTVHTLSVLLALCRLMTDKNDSPAKPERHIAHQSSSMAPNSSESSSDSPPSSCSQRGASPDQHCRKGGGRGARWRGRSLPRRRRR